MLTVAEAIRQLEGVAPMGRAAGWDPVGLQVGDPRATVERIAVCHDVTTRVVDEVIAAGVDLLVSYHPVLFEATRRFVAGPGPGGLALRLARHGTNVVVVHTAFDAAPGGTADALAEALGLAEVAPFGPLWASVAAKVVTFVPGDSVDDVAEAMAAAGAGRIGDYTGCSFRVEGVGTFRPGEGASPAVGEVGTLNREPEVRLEMVVPAHLVDRVVAALAASHPYEEPAYDVYERRREPGFVGRIGEFEGTLALLCERVRADLAGTQRVSGDPGRQVGRVASVPGSGASLIDAAASAGADVLVTGDVKHHDARRAVAQGLAVVDPGHAATERPGIRNLYAAVSSRWGDALDLTAIDADPWTA